MKNINKFIKAFSLAELMVVMLILTIILAATMPILSKRAKVKAAAVAASGSGAKTCIKSVSDSNWSTTLKPGVQYFHYSMVGGGGGGVGYSGSGGGGSSAILIDSVLQVEAAGGDGATGQCASCTRYPATDGAYREGVLQLDPSVSHTLTVYTGGGGGGAGWNWMEAPLSGGGGGAGYHGGCAGSTYNGNGAGLGGLTCSQSQLYNGYHSTSLLGAILARGGAASVGGTTTGTGGGGGGYGGKGGSGTNRAVGTKGADSGSYGDGKAGTQIIVSGESWGGNGGNGGNVMIYYLTTASSCSP